ncbi:hypothetical protein ALC53_13282, partial [Atta colombica]
LVDGVNETLAVSELALVYATYQNAHFDVVMYFTNNLVPGNSGVSSRVVLGYNVGEFKLGLPGVDEGVDGVPGGDASNGQTKLPKSISFLLFLRFSVN